MIFDNIRNCALYENAHKSFPAAFAFIKKAIAEDLPIGKYEIDGEALFASVQEYTSKDSETAKNEGHREHIDIQFVVSGTEKILVEDITAAALKSEYNDVKDVEFYHNAKAPSTLILRDGDFAVVLDTY